MHGRIGEPKIPTFLRLDSFGVFISPFFSRSLHGRGRHMRDIVTRAALRRDGMVHAKAVDPIVFWGDLGSASARPVPSNILSEAPTAKSPPAPLPVCPLRSTPSAQAPRACRPLLVLAGPCPSLQGVGREGAPQYARPPTTTAPVALVHLLPDLNHLSPPKSDCTFVAWPACPFCPPFLRKMSGLPDTPLPPVAEKALCCRSRRKLEAPC
jgi:hypothetical protein